MSVNKKKHHEYEEKKAAEYNLFSTDYNIYCPGGKDGVDPDMIIDNGIIQVGLEHKKDLNARMENPTIAIKAGKAIGNTNLGNFIAEYLNNNCGLDKFMSEFNVVDFPVNPKNDFNNVLNNILLAYSLGGSTTACDNYPIEKLGEFTNIYYAKKNCHYLQATAQDSFYRLSDEDPLNLGMDIPLYKGDGKFKLRYNFDVLGDKQAYYEYMQANGYPKHGKGRTSKQSVEYKLTRANWVLKEGGEFRVRFLPEVHMDLSTIPPSNYSLELNTNKTNPLI